MKHAKFVRTFKNCEGLVFLIHHNPHVRLIHYNSLVLPWQWHNIVSVWRQDLEYNSTVMGPLHLLQNNGARRLLDLPKYFFATESLSTLNWKPLHPRRRYHRCLAINYMLHINHLQLIRRFMQHSQLQDPCDVLRLHAQPRLKWANQQKMYQNIKRLVYYQYG